MYSNRAAGFFLPMMVALIAGGCASSPGTLVARQEANGLPTLNKAQQDGAYGLFIAGDADPLFAVQVHAGDDIGFERSTAATVGSLQISYLYAVYGGNRYRLDSEKTYEWRWLYAGKR